MIYRQIVLVLGITAAAFGVALALVSLPGCGNEPDTASIPSRGTQKETRAVNGPAADDANGGPSNPAEDVGDARPSRADRPLFDSWPTPAVAVVLTGQQRGYIEPCGCTSGQSGGISRRASLVNELKEKGWPVTAFDLGGIAGRNRRQSQLKFETVLAALKDMGYRGVGIAPAELRFGADYLLSQHVSDESDPDGGVSFLGANVVLYEAPDLGTPAPFRVATIDGHKIGVTAVVGKSIADQSFADDPPANVTLNDAAESLVPVVEELKKQQTSLNILLAYAGTEESAALAKQFPAFDVVVSAGGPEDPARQPQTVGKSLLLHVGQKGKYVGVIGFYPDDADKPLRYQLVELKKDRFEDDMQMVEHMRYYQDRLREEKLAATELPIRHPSGAEFVGAEKCGECHTTAYAIWKETPHAHAYESLKHAREGDPEYGITRVYDAECLACHVTGWHPQEVLRYETGFVNEEFATNEEDRARSKLLKGQQCESCHGPGSRHVELVDEGEIDAARESVRVTLKQAAETTCIQCHDLDNSPNFKFKPYWERVKHYGTD